MSDEKTVTGRQQGWCDVTKHLIPLGGKYVNLPEGGTACLEHRDMPIPEVMLAGSLA